MTDGLRAEREQGITIDVAYRYAATPHRKFVIADCPGHVQYTSNMATGASTADLALVLVDATSGLREQSRRHICIAALLGVDQLIVCANKMDLVAWDRSAYQRIADEMEAVGTPARDLLVHGDPAVRPPRRQRGGTLGCRSVVRRPHRAPRPRVGPGRRVGRSARCQPRQRGPSPRAVGAPPARGRPELCRDGQRRPLPCRRRVVVLPQGARTSLPRIETADGPLQRAEVGLSVSLRLADHLDVSRGDLIAAADGPPEVTDSFEATVCWFQDRPLVAGDRLRIKHTTRVTPAVVESVTGIFDVNELRSWRRTSCRERHRDRPATDRTPLAVTPTGPIASPGASC